MFTVCFQNYHERGVSKESQIRVLAPIFWRFKANEPDALVDAYNFVMNLNDSHGICRGQGLELGEAVANLSRNGDSGGELPEAMRAGGAIAI